MSLSSKISRTLENSALDAAVGNPINPDSIPLLSALINSLAEGCGNRRPLAPPPLLTRAISF